MTEDNNPLERVAVVVARQWHRPEISVSVNEEGIHVVLMMPDFLRALALEMGMPRALPHLEQSAERVIAGMKDATARVM